MAKDKEGLGMLALVKDSIKESGQSLNQLAEKCGVGRDRLSRFVRGERDLTGKALLQVCEAVGLKLVEEKAPRK